MGEIICQINLGSESEALLKEVDTSQTWKKQFIIHGLFWHLSLLRAVIFVKFPGVSAHIFGKSLTNLYGGGWCSGLATGR
jgi:hypothetical protein